MFPLLPLPHYSSGMAARLEKLDGQLAGFAARLRLAGAWRGVLSGACLTATVFFCYLAADHALALPPVVHYIFCAAFWLALAAGVLLPGLAFFRKESRAALALRLERLLPGTRNHLVNAVQLASGAGAGAAERILAELPPEAWAAAAGAQPGIGQAGRRLGGLLAGYALLALLLLALEPGRTLDTLQCLARPSAERLARRHTVIVNVLPGDVALKPGGDLRIFVQTAGLPPDAATVELECPNRAGETAVLVRAPAELPAAGAPVRWSGVVPKLFNECRYRIVAGGCTSRWYRAGMAAPPVLADWSLVVTPPAYTGASAWTVHRGEMGGRCILLGSKLYLEGVADSALRQAVAQGGGRAMTGGSRADGRRFKAEFAASATGALSICLTGISGVQATHDLPFAVTADAVPVISAATAAKVQAPPLGEVAVGFAAGDDAGLHAVGIERVDADGRTAAELQRMPAVAPGRTEPPLRATGKFVLNVAKLGIGPGRTARVRLFADDGHPAGVKHRGYSAVVEIAVQSPQDQAAEKKRAGTEAERSLSALVRMQQDNAAGTAKLAATGDGNAIANGPIRAMGEVQADILRLGLELLRGDRRTLGELADTLARLAAGEMPKAADQLEVAAAVNGPARLAALGESLVAQRRILAALSGLKDGLAGEVRQQSRRDLMELFRQLVKRQEENLKATQAVRKAAADKRPAPGDFRPLAKVEDQIAEGLTGFDDAAAETLRAAPTADGFQAAVREARRLLAEKRTYEAMILAAEALDARKADPAVQRQAEALHDLLAVLDVLNKWSVRHAKEVVKDATEKLKEMDGALKEMEALQNRIKTATDELARDGKKMDDPGVKETLRAMDKQQEPMAELVEKMANDLYQFPDLPVANELNGKMREVFEDVQQAKDSEHAPAVEIAVQKEDALLDAIRAVKKRVEDVEMWLPDVPDNIVWNMESFDTDEFPDIPLVPLPDELEDIVGELLKQDPAIAAQSQDTTGNNMIADGEMGWGIMDGPMPSFSAKGKSGNAAPNDNEMTGRSGAGREGKSSGELVENKVKGLEGRATEARYTKDPLQKGQVTEDESSTLKARGTGGGKLGGESESIGMFGKAPRRDLGVADHGGSMTPLRQEVEAQYTRARLLYVNGGRLADAARELRNAEFSSTAADYGSLCRRVVRQLQDSRFEQQSGAVLPMATEIGASGASGSAAWDFDIEQVRDPAYRETIRSYFRGLQTPAPETPAAK